jgi:hypothetical protein
MNKILNIIKTILMIEKDSNMKIGLTQFKQQGKIKPLADKKPSITTKDVKLSDLMRKVG